MHDSSLNKTNANGQPQGFIRTAVISFNEAKELIPTSIRTMLHHPRVRSAGATLIAINLLCAGYASWYAWNPDAASRFASGVGEVLYETKEATVRGLRHIG